MTNLIIGITLLILAGCGYLIMEKIDAFLEKIEKQFHHML
jgi:hypothetical protein